MADVICIDRLRERAAHVERARELRESMRDLYRNEYDESFEFKQRVVILWQMLNAEIMAADALAQVRP